VTSEIVVCAEGVSKAYLIGHATSSGERYTALRDVIARSVHNLARTTRDMLHGRQIIAGDSIEEFWALDDVSFEIRRGEVVGIIGRNGAGKSTLLKVLSRITEPSRGRVSLRGRVASLLEVGTGFHPELTGRENIFLNGAILGMTRLEIRQKFDEIVDFAEIERFLDTPVKRYSSGMYVRLAFAVAAHLEPEILIVDEVLAVGDSQFQKKCLGKMQNVAGDGRTVIFVSHNMSAIRSLTRRVLVLKAGRLLLYDEPNRAILEYASTDKDQAPRWIATSSHGALVEIREWRLISLHSNNEIAEFDVFESFALEIEFFVKEQVKFTNFAFNLETSDGTHILSTHDFDTSERFQEKKAAGSHRVRLTFPAPLLNTGTYIGRISTGSPGLEVYDVVQNVIFIIVDRTQPIARRDRRGHIITDTRWELISYDAEVR